MNVFQFSQLAEANWKANLENMTDWRPQYTFYSDFGIAEFCQVKMANKDAILDTFKRVIKSWSGSYQALAEIVLVLNHKIWAYYPNNNKPGVDGQYLGIDVKASNSIATIYNDLWGKAEDIFFKKYGKNEEAVSYYYSVTD